MICHITTREAWQAAQSQGSYRAESLATEGFIHCSTRRQVLSVANSFYRGAHDLLLLQIDEHGLDAPLVWEAPAHPDPDKADEFAESGAFPHIYGALNLDAVVGFETLREGRDGYEFG